MIKKYTKTTSTPNNTAPKTPDIHPEKTYKPISLQDTTPQHHVFIADGFAVFAILMVLFVLAAEWRAKDLFWDHQTSFQDHQATGQWVKKITEQPIQQVRHDISTVTSIASIKKYKCVGATGIKDIKSGDRVIINKTNCVLFPNQMSPEWRLLFSKKIDLNRVSALELSKLSVIGHKKSTRIIGYRKQLATGRFNSLRQLLEVKGIGPATLDKLKPYLYLPLPPTTQ